MQYLLEHSTMSYIQLIIVLTLFVLAEITMFRIMKVWIMEEEEYLLSKYGYNERE
jgi:protein-S-isoprenylcysteine O-methyltransferase Ste14